MARYDSLRKLDRNREVCEYAEEHQDLSQKEIGEKFAISKSRVSRILKAAKQKALPPSK